MQEQSMLDQLCEEAACRHLKAYLHEVTTDADSALAALATLQCVIQMALAIHLTPQVMQELANRNAAGVANAVARGGL